MEKTIDIIYEKTHGKHARAVKVTKVNNLMFTGLSK